MSSRQKRENVLTQNYNRLVKLSAICAISCAAILVTIKVIAWWITGSVSLLAAVFDSFVDMGASLTNLLVLRYALQPPDHDHTFGHGKAESLAALAQSMFISGSAIFLIMSGAYQFINPAVLRTPDFGIIVIAISLVFTIALLMFQRKVVKSTGSQAIQADMVHYQSDVLMNVAVLIALALSWYGFVRADSIFAILIGFYILYSAWHIGYSAVQALLDRALPEEERAAIIEIIRSYKNVKGAHDLKTRQSGPIKFIQFHIELEDELPLVEAHAIGEEVEQALLARFPDSEVIIHQDPCSAVGEERERWQF